MAKRETLQDRTCRCCEELHRLATENPDWAAPLRFGAFIIATKYKIPKNKRLWEGTHRRIRSKKA